MKKEIKTGIKMRVTPKESKEIQELLFTKGLTWCDNTKEIQNLDVSFLFIDVNGYLSQTNNERYFLSSEDYEEVSAKLFISTQGTCIQEEQTKHKTPDYVPFNFRSRIQGESHDEFAKEYTQGIEVSKGESEKEYAKGGFTNNAFKFVSPYGLEDVIRKGDSNFLTETPQPKEPKKEYMIFVSGGKAPKVVHTTLESAQKEAKRLSAKEIGREIFIMEKVKSFKSRIIVEEITEEKPKGDN